MTPTREAIRRELAGRPLIWFGIRGEDAAPLLQLPEFRASYAITSPLPGASIADGNVTLESISGKRVDLDQYEPDDDVSEAMRGFRRRLRQQASGRCVVTTYRPVSFVSALAFAMSETMTLAGLFRDRQRAFEHKPWVETSLQQRGVQTLAWRYVADEFQSRAEGLLNTGSVVLRASRTSGGVGISRVDDRRSLVEDWPVEDDEFVGVAPYLDGALPLNVSGCVFPDGQIRLHPPSVQLIGLSACTSRQFGYCGNDFAAAADLPRENLDELDTMTRQVGAWLHHERYCGAFGVDALVHQDRVIFTEINARFQGSSGMSASLAQAMGESDLYMDHLAATLGLLPQSPGLTLLDWARRQPRRAHVVVHNQLATRVQRSEQAEVPRMPSDTRLSQLPARETVIDSGAVVFRLTVDRGVTATGYDLDSATATLVSDLLAIFQPASLDSDAGVNTDGVDAGSL